MDEPRLYQFFQEELHLGKPSRILIVKNSLGRSRGFGYVEFDTPELAERAIEKSGTVLEGRAISITASNRGITMKRDRPRPTLLEETPAEDMKAKTNDYFRNLIAQKQKKSSK